MENKFIYWLFRERYELHPTDECFYITLRTAFIRGGDFAASLTRSEYEEKIKALEGKIKSMMNL